MVLIHSLSPRKRVPQQQEDELVPFLTLQCLRQILDQRFRRVRRIRSASATARAACYATPPTLPCAYRLPCHPFPLTIAIMKEYSASCFVAIRTWTWTKNERTTTESHEIASSVPPTTITAVTTSGGKNVPP